MYTPRLIYICLHDHLMASHERDQLTHGPTLDTGYITKLFEERETACAFVADSNRSHIGLADLIG